MNTVNTAGFYNKLYRAQKNVYGTRPSDFVKQIPRIMRGGRVLDLGAGQGRNSLFLTSHGFDVTAIDLSADGIEDIRQKATSWGMRINTQVSDVLEASFEGMYDVIICSYVLHHLSRDEAMQTIARMQKHTKQGGFNIISAFMANGELFHSLQKKDLYFPQHNKMKELYAGWGVPKYTEGVKRCHTRRPDRTQVMNSAASIMVRKI